MSTVPSSESAKEAAIQLLSPVLGSATVVAVAGLGLTVLATVVLVVVAAGFSAGFSVDRGGLSGSGVSIDGRLIHAIARHNDPIGLLRRRRGHIGLNHHVRCHDPCSIHHATSSKCPTSRRHKPRGHKRPARARNTAVGTGRIEPRGIDGKPTAGRTIAKARILQIHAIGAHARSEPGARGNDAPAAAHGHVACDHAGNRLVRNIGPVRPGIDGATVHHERLRDVDPALRARCR